MVKMHPVGLPKRKYLDLPFFAYGIFKPGQSSYHRIEKYVKDEPCAEIIAHEMRYRDGLAIIVGEENETFKTRGYLIEFTNSRQAYKKIGRSQRSELYEWKQVEVNGKKANALVGVDADNGSFENKDYIISTYDYRQDHFFNEALYLIDDTIKEFDGKKINSMKDFFNIQMNYMLLWSIIERFCTITYGHFDIGLTMQNFAEEKSFEKELENVNRNDDIYSSDTLKPKSLDPDNPDDSIYYYYTIRCNVVHKGKFVKSEDFNKLKESFEELFGLFMAVYNEKLMQNNEILEKYPEKNLDS